MKKKKYFDYSSIRKLKRQGRKTKSEKEKKRKEDPLLQEEG